MPTSNLALAPLILWLVESADPHDRVLDVGPGHGKYATLLREYLNDPPSVIDAVEAHAPYIGAHRLGDLYDTVTAADVCELSEATLAAYDVVLMVDVIEHIDKAEALDFLGRVRGRVVICTPVEFFSNGPGLPASEEHRSHWTEGDFVGTGRVEEIENQWGGWVVRLGPISQG